MIFDFDTRSRFARLAQMVYHRPKQRGCASGDIVLYRFEGGLDGLLRLFRVEQIGVDQLEQRRIQFGRLWYDLAVG